jgi:putative oxidoreductase
MRTVTTVLVRVLQILLGLLFVLVGVMKFRDPSWVRNFARWGYPDGFYMIVGVLEAAGGIGLLISRLTSYAAALLVAVMAAAALTHLVHGEMQRLSAPAVFLVLIALVGWRRRASAWRAARHRLPPSEVVL